MVEERVMVAKPTNVSLPTHLDLPDTDGLPMENDFQPAQSWLLTTALTPVLDRLHPTGEYFVGHDVGIYWKQTDPPLNGCKAPDWYYVPGAKPFPPGQYRRSFVMWQEELSPLIAIEFVSGDGEVEHNDTPGTGKFWVYRRGIRAGYYAIHEPLRPSLEVYKLDGTEYRRVDPNAAGVIPIPELGAALGHWRGRNENREMCWLRFFTPDGLLLPSLEERTKVAEDRIRRATAELERAETEARSNRAELDELVAKLRAKGIDPDSL